MQFFLANPAWLWLLALGAVPLLVHLFARSNPPKYEFSNTEFLRKILKKTARMRKPQDWLLLILRTLAVLALLFVFLQPLLTSDGEIIVGKKTTIYLIDRSASMVCKDGASSRFSSACAKASELIQAAKGHEANVVWIDAGPDAVFPQPGQNLDFLHDALARAEARSERGAISSAVGLALAQLNQVEGARELVVISDFQASAWKDFQLQVPKGVRLVKVPVGETDTQNLAVSELFATPSDPVVGQDVIMVCRVRNFSPEPRRTTLYLEFGGGRQSCAVEIPAWGEAEANFQTHFEKAGQVQLTASISEDAFSGDNVRHALVDVKETLKIVSVAPSEGMPRVGAPQVLARLASSLEWLDHSSVKDGDYPASGAVDYLFVHDWKGGDIEKLRELAESGTTIIVHPSTGVSMKDCESILGYSTGSGDAAIAQDTKGLWKAGISDQSNQGSKVFALFANGEFGNPASGTFKERLRLPSEWPKQVVRLIDYTDGVAGMLSVSGDKAPVILWNLPLADSLSSWPGQTAFVPFMGELLLNSRAAQQSRGAEILPGGVITWMPADGVSIESVSLHDEGGKMIEVDSEMTGNGVQLKSKVQAEPGVYHWKVSEGLAYQQISNFPETESDLRLMNPDAVEGGEVVDSKQLLQRAELGDGVPLWPWFLAAVLLFLLSESLVAMWRPKPAKT